MEQHATVGVVGRPLLRERLHRAVAAVAVDDEDAAKATVRAEWFGGFDGHTFGEDAVHGEPQMAVLLRAPERQHGAAVVLHVSLHLHPVRVADAHGGSGSVGDLGRGYGLVAPKGGPGSPMIHE